MKLKLTYPQFEMIYSLMRHVRLGQDSEYSKAAFELLEQLEEKHGVMDDELPGFSVEFSEQEGVVINF